jgi:hypothetical protein
VQDGSPSQVRTGAELAAWLVADAFHDKGTLWLPIFGKLELALTESDQPAPDPDSSPTTTENGRAWYWSRPFRVKL